MFDIKIESDPSLEGLNDSNSIEILKHILISEGSTVCNVSIIFGDKKLLQDLKNKFFNIDRTTDVIAFRLNEYQKKEIEGEIYICLEVAKENAQYYNEPYEREIARLIIHGGLHLLGYADGTKVEQQEMKNLEEKYLKELKY